MPILIVGLGSLAIAALSLTKDIVKETDQAGDEIQGIIMNTTFLIVAGVGLYLMATDKLSLSIK